LLPRRVCGIATDTIGVEVWPPEHEARPFGFLYRLLLGSVGMALGELWWLHDLARDCVARCTSCCLPAPR
jgi:hypothetical protein